MKSNNSWTTNLLSDLSESIKYGHTASATDKDTKTKFLRITDIQDGFVDWESVPFCECSEKEQNKYELTKGDIVFARTGATTGKSFLIDDYPPKSVFASYLIRVRPNAKIYPKYLYQFFQTANYWGQVSASSSGTAQAGVNATKLSNLKIPLPPLPEQKRIAEVLDKADALREKRRLALQKLDTLLQSVFLEMFGDPVKNPMGWESKRLDEVADIQRNGISPEDINDDTYYVGLENITREGSFVEVPKVENGEIKSTKFHFDRRHILYGKLRPYLKKISVPDFEGVCSTDILPILIKNTITKSYLHQYLRLPQMVGLATARSSGANLPRISPKVLSEMKILVPSKEMQDQFSIFQTKISNSKRNQLTELEKLENLFQSLQQKAFKGELFDSELENELTDEKKVWQQTSLS